MLFGFDEYTQEDYLRLKKQITENNYRYYVLDQPVLSDGEFDSLMTKLREIEMIYPGWITPDSPTQRVGGVASDKFRRVQHPVAILSLANAFSPNDLAAWRDRISKLNPAINKADFVIEPKIDGLTLVLTYENGVLVQGTTRGDGIEGEDVTANTRAIHSIPLAIPVDGNQSVSVPDQLIVRGEVYIRISDFEKLNDELASQGEKQYLNPRNTAAGSLRQLNPAITAKRPLRIFVYQIIAASGGNVPETQWETLQYLKALGFPVNNDSLYAENFEDMIQFVKGWEQKRAELDYEIDGIVVKVNDLSLADNLGVVGKDPRGAIALKFPAREVTTRLEDIGVSVGRTGVLTPFAMLEAVEVSGVVVKQATLHNFDFIASRDIRIGDRVFVKRAGDVIPYVIGPIPEMRTGNERVYAPPMVCPICGEPTERFPEEVAVYCVNHACPAQLIRNVEHFASRNAMEITGLGIKIVEQLCNQHLIGDVADLFSLSKETLLQLDGFADKKADNLLESLENAKKQTLPKLIFALGIHGIGEVAARMLAEKFRSLNALKEAAYESIVSIDGFGPSSANAVIDWFARKHNITIVDKLIQAGVNPIITIDESAVNAHGVLNDLSIVVTGSLVHFTRESIKNYILAHGGKPTDSVSKKTDFVIVGENPGSKIAKAETLGIPILSEDEFLKKYPLG